MFGHDYTKEEQDALDAVREREVWGSISPAGLHNDDRMYADSSEDEIATLRAELERVKAENLQLRTYINVLETADVRSKTVIKILRIQTGIDALLPAAPEEGE